MVWIHDLDALRSTKSLAERLAEDEERMARINTPVAPTTTPTLTGADQQAQARQTAPALPAPTPAPAPAAPAPSPAQVQPSGGQTARQPMTLREQIEAAQRDSSRQQVGTLQDLTTRRQTETLPIAPLGGQGGANVENVLSLNDLLELNQRQRTDSVQRSLTDSFPIPQGDDGSTTPFGGALPNMEQVLGRQGPTSLSDFMQQIGAGAATGLGAAGQGFDAASETLFDFANTNPLINAGTLGIDALADVATGGGDDVLADFRRRALGGGLPQNIIESKGDPFATLGRQGEDFESRPTLEQFGVGAVADPLNAIPGIGAADDIADIIRLGTAAGRKLPGAAGRAGRGAIEAGARQAVPSPTLTERLAGGVIDPTTGRPFDYSPVLGGANRGDDITDPVVREIMGLPPSGPAGLREAPVLTPWQEMDADQLWDVVNQRAQRLAKAERRLEKVEDELFDELPVRWSEMSPEDALSKAEHDVKSAELLFDEAQERAYRVSEGKRLGLPPASGAKTHERIEAVRTFLSDETGAVDLTAVADAGSSVRRKLFGTMAEREGRVPGTGIADDLIPTEKTIHGVLRQYEGARGAGGIEIRETLDQGKQILKDHGFKGTTTGTRFEVKRSDEMVEFYKALHGEAPVPPRLQGMFDDIQARLAQETAETAAADPNFVPRDDYFFRGWKAPKQTQTAGGRGSFGAKAGFQKPRNDLTFTQMLDEGWEPATWNPYEMLSMRRSSGIEWRSQQKMLDQLKQSGLALSPDEAPADWVVPRIGPAFEGKMFASADDLGDATLGRTQRWAVKPDVAQNLEDLFGTRGGFGKIGDGALSLSTKAKLLKLSASLFQDVDFAFRTLGSMNASVIDEIYQAGLETAKLHPARASRHMFDAGKKFAKVPVEIGKLPVARLSPGSRRNLRRSVISDTPIMKERPGITLRGISEAGASFGEDISIVTRDIRDDLLRLADEAPPTGMVRPAASTIKKRINQINQLMQRGLFEGVYVSAQKSALENHIVPRLIRQHPDWTDSQIMGEAANIVNIRFSALRRTQSYLQNPAMRDLARTILFSTNETEGLLRGAASTVIGGNKGQWQQFYLGSFLGIAATANLVNYATTGEWLDWEQYSPISTSNYGPLPISYNSEFLAASIGERGRGGVNLSLDLVGQLDTAFRVLDPKSFFESRLNVLPRALMNQYGGADFYGNPLLSAEDRVKQAAIDVLEPIGLGQIRGALGLGRNPEPRVGSIGNLIQGSGLNVRAETTPQVRDRLAQEWALANGITENRVTGEPIRGWDDLEPYQQLEVAAQFEEAFSEIERRTLELANQGNEFAERSVEADAVDEDRKARQTASNEQLERYWKTDGKAGIGPQTWKADRRVLLAETAGKKDIIYAGLEPGDAPGRQVLNGYYNAIEKATKDGQTNWEEVDRYLAGLNSTERAVIEDNTGLTRTELESQYYDDLNVIERAGFWDTDDRQDFLDKNPRVLSLLEKWDMATYTRQSRAAIKGAEDAQKGVDAELFASDKGAWREATQAISNAKALRLDQIFSDLPDQPRNVRTAVDQYFAIIDANKTDYTNEVNWAEVDKWLNQQPASVREYIDNREREYTTPAVQEWKEASRKISDTGYWDVNDVVLESHLKQNPALAQLHAQLPEGAGLFEFKDEFKVAAKQTLVESGYSETQAEAVAGRATDKLFSEIDQDAIKVRRRMREQNPELLELLVLWDYYDPSADATGQLLGQ